MPYLLAISIPQNATPEPPVQEGEQVKGKYTWYRRGRWFFVEKDVRISSVCICLTEEDAQTIIDALNAMDEMKRHAIEIKAGALNKAPDETLVEKADNLTLRIASIMPYVRHKPECDLSGRDWPVKCTCGLDDLRALLTRQPK
jgi:hypothetical protein